MYSIINNSTSPCFNLAAEQYLLECKIGGELFMLWRGEPSVIIGRNQNAYAEIDHTYCEANGIEVVRRLSGGGAVFHDLGNLNYTFIADADDGSTLNFQRFCAPVIGALRSLGLNAELSGRNDILIDGRKISGSAQCVHGGRMLHHGTLLYSSNLTSIQNALRPDSAKLAAKGIKSVASRVADIKELGGLDMSVTEFAEYLRGYIGGERIMLGEASEREINAIADRRYRRWEWNFGQSKRYVNEVRRRFPFGGVEISYTLDGGAISEISVTGDFFGGAPIEGLERRLIGVRFERVGLSEALRDVGMYINGCDAETICEALLGS